MVLQDGQSVDYIHTFDELVVGGKYMSSPRLDTFAKKQSIFYYVPVNHANTPVAFLIGVINCDHLSSYFKSKIYNGQTQNYIIDTKSQTLVMNEKNNTDTTYNIMKDYTLDSDYSNDKTFDNISNLKTGVVKYHKENDHFYMYYCPVGIFGWVLLIVVNENITFQSLLNMQKSYIFLIVFIVLLLGDYFGFNVYRIHKINEREKAAEKEKEEISHKLDIANILLACVKELSSNVPIRTSINYLLKIINAYFKGERSYLIEVNKEGCVDTIYEYRIKDSSIYTIESQKLELQNLDFSPIFSIDKEIIYFKNILDEIPSDAQMYTALKNQNIHDLIIVPFKDNSEVYALLGIDNPEKTQNILISSILSNILLENH